jgi:abequosyltransferase
LLTLIIPTYNRAANLELLLNSLIKELNGVDGQVDIIIGNNCSTDRTVTVIEAFRSTVPKSMIFHHDENLGADENFCYCVNQVKTRFFWIIGDDDLPKTGVIRQVVHCLENKDPDLLYLNSEWLSEIRSTNDGTPVTDVNAVSLTRTDFARQVNVWITFITGMVVNVARLRELNPEINISRFIGTNLVQLGWILPLLMTAERLLIIPQRCILATSANTGGYKLFLVFGTNFPAVMNSVCGSTSLEYKHIFSALSWSYIPELMWATRFGLKGRFAEEDVIGSLAPLKGFFAYRFIILPIATLPRYLALHFLAFSKICVWLKRFRYYI